MSYQISKEQRDLIIESISNHMSLPAYAAIIDELSDKELYQFLKANYPNDYFNIYPSLLKQVIVRTRYKILQSSSTWTSR